MAKKDGKNARLISSSNEAFNRFEKVFEQLSYAQDYSTTFTDFLDFTLFQLSAMRTKGQIETMKNMDRRYKAEQGALMGELFTLFTHAAENYGGDHDKDGLEFNTKGKGFHDVLGDLFMDLVSHGHNGQYFTPQNVCDMMSLMVMGDHNPDMPENPTVCDPACGSGRMLLSAAKVNRHAIFYGADISDTCVKMTALNMTVNTMVGEVACMNTLSMEHYHSWHIRRVLVDGYWIPILFQTGKNETRMFGTQNAKELITDYSYNLNDKGEMVKMDPAVNLEARSRWMMIRKLFFDIPGKDTRETIKAAAASSMYLGQKYELFKQHEATPEQNIDTLPPPVENVNISPGKYSDQMEGIVKEYRDYRRKEPDTFTPGEPKKPAIVKKLKPKKDDLPKTGTLF